MGLLFATIRHLVVTTLDWAGMLVFGPICSRFTPTYKLASASGVFYSNDGGGNSDDNIVESSDDEEEDKDDNYNGADEADYDPIES